MANSYFKFKQFTIHQDRCAMKVTTDACLFGAWCADEIRKLDSEHSTLLDIGTGTALLSLMISQKNKLLVDALEIETEAALQAAENTKASPWAEQINVVEQNIVEFGHKKYDLIVSNPPFYENELSGNSEKKNVAHHSEKLSSKDLLREIKTRMKPEGMFFLLLPSKRLREFQGMLSEQNLFVWKQITVRPSTQHEPFRVMIIGGHAREEQTMFEEISIRDEEGGYTRQFVDLLRDYYLYL